MQTNRILNAEAIASHHICLIYGVLTHFPKNTIYRYTLLSYSICTSLRLILSAHKAATSLYNKVLCNSDEISTNIKSMKFQFTNLGLDYFNNNILFEISRKCAVQLFFQFHNGEKI